MDIFAPLEWLAEWFAYDIFGLVQTSHLAEAVVFFIYDTLKIFLLLLLVTHLMGFIRLVLPIEKMRNFLSSHKLYGLDYFLAACFGCLTPFCSCSSVPLFIGFIQAGIPLGITFSFLIASPLVNEIAIVLLLGIFGWKITLAYVLSGIIVAILGGFLLGKLKREKYVESFIWQNQLSAEQMKIKKAPQQIWRLVSKEAWTIIRQVGPYVIVGIAIGSIIHGFIPASYIENILIGLGFWGVPLSVLLAVPIYSNASGVIPILEALVTKGVPLGTALAFMMAVVGLSFPEGIMLKKILKWPLLLMFFGVVTVGIIGIGYFLNLFLLI